MNLQPIDRGASSLRQRLGPYELAEGSWDTERTAYLSRVLGTLEEYCPGVTASVLHDEVLAPPDIEERYRQVEAAMPEYGRSGVQQIPFDAGRVLFGAAMAKLAAEKDSAR